MRAQHTPGPWVVRDSLGLPVHQGIEADNGTIVAIVYGRQDDEPIANARLIAAAPELYEACEESRQDFELCTTVETSKAIACGAWQGRQPPEDVAIKALCEKHGYGAIMDSACRQWLLKDPVGAHTVGPCRGTVDSILAQLRAALKKAGKT